MGQKRAILEDEEAAPFKVATKRICEHTISASGRSDPDTNDSGHGSVNRCFGCRRKVGLMGFRCRCGDVFCWEHRYSDRHDCDFDYKEAGRVVIARENPVIRPVKILKV